MPAAPPRFLSGSPRVLRPGVPTLPPGVERHALPGQGALLLNLRPGDRLRIVDEHGGQPAEIAARPAGGERWDPAPLGAKANCGGGGIQSLLARNGAPAVRLRESLSRAVPGFSPRDIRAAVSRLGPESRPGDEAEFSAADDSVVVVAAPGDDMPPEGGDPPTSLIVFVERAAPPPEDAPPELPPPLADPREDFRIPRATARCYEVRAGEWIQIIDVEGRQCTDFQAFSAAALDRGRERCVDVTASRTVAGRAIPAPGTRAKYCDCDFQPLAEVVQDSCERHDAFGLACTAKYYEDMGYPGHVNCSDNFSAALAPRGVAPRKGWASMNFFFNSGYCEMSQTFASDEPWSRPGDFVLLRALTDLVCVSSACPDDIDPANGWNPTEIHVRTYGPELRAKRSVWFRRRPDKEMEMTQETGFHPRTAALTRDFAEYHGFWLPTRYAAGGAVPEYWACREKAAVMDLSPLRKFEVLGPDAEALLQYALTRDIRRLGDGQVVYTAMCHKTGGMIDDGTVFRLGENNFRWIGGCDSGGEWLQKQARELNLDARVRPSSAQLHNIAVQGPLSRDIVREILWTPPDRPELDELRWFRFTVGRLGGPDGPGLVVSRTGYTGELGFEIFCHPKDAPAVWDRTMEVGAPLGMSPLGLDALDILRIESGLAFANHEFDDQTDPFEAGVGFTVALKTKPDDFVGRAALEKREANPQRILVGLELAGEEPAAHGDGVFVGRNRVGVVTSATRSPVLRKNIALCRMAVEHSALGSEAEVGKLDGHQKRLPAVVVRFPFYDPEKKKPRS